MRLVVYSHDAFGLGNIRRMLAICQHLLATIPNLSILVLSGSPAIHNFKIPARLDYIKLPCLGRDRQGNLAAKFLSADVQETVQLRSNLIRTAVADFRPDLILVDKKPYGLLGELKPALDLLKSCSPQTKLVLLLRDILDSPSATIKEWHQKEYYPAITHYYDRVLIAGMAEVFNLVSEYKFPQIIVDKTVFCGYLKKDFCSISSSIIREGLKLEQAEKFIVVTPGGGEDGFFLINSYLSALSQIKINCTYKTLIIFGVEMPRSEKQKLQKAIDNFTNIITFDFTDNLLNYFQAADLVVSMAGYNTVTEILSLGKKLIVIPRNKPSQEQSIRAEKMKKLGLLTAVKPNRLVVKNLGKAIMQQLNSNSQFPSCLDFNGLLNIQREIVDLLPSQPNLSLVSLYKNFNYYPVAKLVGI